jgi:hypothetical protein
MLIQLKIVNYYICKLYAPVILVNLLFFFAYIKVFLQYLIPGVMRFFSNFKFDNLDQVNPWAVVNLYIIEYISWGFYLLALLITIGFLFKKNEKLTVDQFINKNLEFSKKFIILCSVGLCYITYLSVSEETKNPIILIMRSLFYYVGLGAGPLLLFFSGKYFNKNYFYLGLVVTALGSITIGTRGAILYMICFVIFIVWGIIKDKSIKRAIIFIITLLIIAYSITGGVPAVPIGLSDNGELTIEIKSNSDKSEGRSKIEEIDWRFGAATRMGTKFYDMYDRGDSAGLNPIKHSFFGFLPRFIEPDKPIPSTLIPDDIYSQGMYLISRETNGYDTHSMTEFPTGAHFYWEFGLTGVAILSVLSAIYISIAIKIFSRFGLASIPLVLATLKPWGYMEPKIWISDAVMQFYQLIIPTFIIYFSYYTFYHLIRKWR